MRLQTTLDAENLAKKIANIAYNIKVEGPLVSFYTEDNDFDMSNYMENVLDSWKVNSSLEEVYLQSVAEKEE